MSIDYRIKHTTTFTYPIPVSVCHNIVCLTPRPDPRITIRHTALTITPRPTVVAQRTDTFGNVTHVFAIQEPHDALIVDASADITVSEPAAMDNAIDLPWERVVAGVAEQSDERWFEATPFRYDSPLVSRTHTAIEYVTRAFTPGRGVREAAVELTAMIHNDFTYLPGATHVGTTSEEALRDRRGVCQDFAHAMIAALRSIGLPACYVSGYLRTIPPKGKPRLIGADQSHAWAGVYMGPQLGWVDLDPTNNVPARTDHIPLAVGRDYADVAPIRGAFLGGGKSRLRVSVDVEPKGAQPAGAVRVDA